MQNLPLFSFRTELPTDATVVATKHVITQKMLSKHASPTDCWVALHGSVYNLTKFAHDHPGGSKLILKLAGM